MISSDNTGYTLIELLIVLVIISITTTFAVLAFNQATHFHSVENTTRQLIDTLSLAQQQAMLQSMTLGLSVRRNRYQFFRYVNGREAGDNGHWDRLLNNPQLNPWSLPSDIVLTPRFIDSSLMLSNTKMDQFQLIIFYSNGELTPFVLDISNRQGGTHYRIIGKENGVIMQMPLRGSYR